VVTIASFRNQRAVRACHALGSTLTRPRRLLSMPCAI